MSSNRPVINIDQGFSSIFDAFYFSNDPEKMLRPKQIPGSEYGPYKMNLYDFGAQPNSVSGMDSSQAQRLAMELTGGHERQLTTKTVNDFLKESLSGVERETQGGALSAMVGFGHPSGPTQFDYSKRTRPLSIVFGDPGETGRSAGHWQEGSFKIWMRNYKDLPYARRSTGRMLRHETGHLVSTSIAQNVRILDSNIRTGKAGAGFDFFDAAGQRTLPPIEDETLRYSWMRQRVLSAYRDEAKAPSHISEMMFRAMEQNARFKYLKSLSFIATISLSTK